MKTCPNCLKENADSNIYCINCGHLLDENIDAVDENSVASKNDTNQKKSHYSLAIIIPVIILFIIVFIISISLIIKFYIDAFISNQQIMRTLNLAMGIVTTIQLIVHVFNIIYCIICFSKHKLIKLPFCILVFLFSGLVSGFLLIYNYGIYKSTNKIEVTKNELLS